MRKNKSGEPVIPKEWWSLKANMHRQFADELLGTVEAAGTVGAALLQSTVERHRALADVCDELCRKVAKGRPKKAIVNQLAVMLSIPKPPLKRPGRPRKVADVDMDETTYHVVERRRKKLASNNKTKPTVKAAIDSLNAEIALANNVRESKVVKRDFELVHSAYKRGKKKAIEKSQN